MSVEAIEVNRPVAAIAARLVGVCRTGLEGLAYSALIARCGSTALEPDNEHDDATMISIALMCAAHF